ncbi:MAG: hypothetical protein ACO3UN_10550, partial [Candidatus Puniceispirillaceae bacterium]
ICALMNLASRLWRGQEDMMRRNRSIGEMISTVSFFGLAAYLLIFSLGLLEAGEAMRGALGLLAAACCALGGLRFVIANFFAMWRKD